ncbi:hypothetical protein VCHA53O466_50022 [Vibrio chagasii]|nr:hypothetical protein VCHA53O466_50022 [Vibrio chagasii]
MSNSKAFTKTRTFTDAEGIKKAVDEGKAVFWASSNYKVIKDSIGQYLIHSQFNDNFTGLTYADEITLNGDISDFYMA